MTKQKSTLENALEEAYTQNGAECQYKDTQMSTSERLKQVMEVKGFNLKTFAEQADIPY